MPTTLTEALPNPRFRLDPALGIVVMEFRDASGTMTGSIPDPRQLDAYRTARQTEAHPPPPHPAGAAPSALPPASASDAQPGVYPMESK